MLRGHPAAAILAGGQARRFAGRDKSRLVIEGRSIIVRQMEVLQRVAHEIYIVGPRSDLYADIGVPVYADLLPGRGALGGLFTALEVAEADAVLVVGCDLPFLDAGLLGRLVERSGAGDAAWVSTAARGPEPLVACYRRAVRDRVLDRLRAGALKLAELGSAITIVEVGDAEVAEFGPSARLLANLNSPEDYARIESTR
ncbi:MAG: molybdenum cofactor guanylyltransferase [Vicinamibacterales bacterium]